MKKNILIFLIVLHAISASCKSSINETYTFAVGIPLDSLDKDTLLQIAMQVSMQGGEGVFWARSLLGVEYEDVLDGLLRQGSLLPTVTTNADVKVIPNPTNQKCLLKAGFVIEKVTVCNYLGKKVEPVNTIIDSNTFEIDFSNMACGFYFAKIIGEEDAFVKIVYIK